MTDPAHDAPSKSFFRFTATRPVAITMVVLAALVFGAVGLARLPVNLLPDISYPSVTIRTEYAGASPLDVEERVSERVQEAVAVVPGVRRVTSISRPGVSDVVLQFDWGTELTFAVSDVAERIDRVMLPREAGKPLPLRYDPSLDPVLTLGLAATTDAPDAPDLVALRRIAEDEVKQRLSGVPGVAAVKIRGGDEEEIRIAIDPLALSAYRLDITAIGRKLAEENLNAASGSIEEGRTEFLVRALNEFRDLTEIEDVILEYRDRTAIRLRDVATVTRVPADKEIISRLDGRPCVLIDVYREAGSNVVRLCTTVSERVLGTAAQRAFVAAGRHVPPPMVPPAAGAPPPDRMAAFRTATLRAQMTDYIAFGLERMGATVTVLQDQSTFVRTAIDDVLSSAVIGGMLAIAILYLFLRRAGATLILAVSIPVSLVASFAPLFLSGVSLNIMSLGGLALGVGMLVDNSIVVLEAIARARDQGMSRAAAAVTGVSRVAGAVFASTATTVAVFFPIVFVEGVAGQLFRDQSLAVVYSLCMSLLVALFVIPMLASRGGTPRVEVADPSVPPPGRLARGFGRIVAASLRTVWLVVGAVAAAVRVLIAIPTRLFQRAYDAVEGVYPKLLSAALRARALVVLVAFALLAYAIWRVPNLGSEQLPEVHQGELYVDAFLPRESTVERTDAAIAPIESAIAALADVESTFLAVGIDKEELNDSDQGEHSARILVRMHPDVDRRAQEDRVRNAIRRMLDREPQVQSYRFSRPSVLSMDAMLSVHVLGRDLPALRQASADVEAALRELPGLRDVRSTLQRGNTEIAIRLDREKAAALGLDIGAVTQILKAQIQGDVPTRFAERERKIDIRVRVDRDALASYAALLATNVNPAGVPAIPLQSVAELRRTEGPSEIRRLGNLRGAEVQASLAGLDMASTIRSMEFALSEVDLPRGVEARLGPEKAELEQSNASLAMALLLAIFLVYVVLACQFESVLQPMIILVTVPLAIVGVIPTLELFAIPLSVIVFLGGIILAGIVVNNAIVLIDQINQLRDAGADLRDAILEGARTRLRPVLMTTLTTVLGLLPLTGWLAGVPVVGGAEEGVELRAPMAVTVVAGLSVSTLLTLIVVPVFYSFVGRRIRA